MPNRDIFYFARCVRKLALYSEVIRLQISRRTRWLCLKCVIVYLALDIPAFETGADLGGGGGGGGFGG